VVDIGCTWSRVEASGIAMRLNVGELGVMTMMRRVGYAG
jgi:hypothetical protein